MAKRQPSSRCLLAGSRDTANESQYDVELALAITQHFYTHQLSIQPGSQCLGTRMTGEGGYLDDRKRRLLGWQGGACILKKASNALSLSIRWRREKLWAIP